MLPLVSDLILFPHHNLHEELNCDLIGLGFNSKTNHKCIIRLLDSIAAATPDVAVTNVIKRLDLNCASNAR